MRFPIIVLLILLLIHHVNSENAASVCTGAFDKCLGTISSKSNMDIRINKDANISTITPNLSISMNKSVDCRSKCISMSWCFLGLYKIRQKQCDLYDALLKSKVTLVSGKNNAYLWECCDQSKLCYPVKDRCPGYWIAYEGWMMDTEKYPPIDNVTHGDCLKACLDNIWCSALDLSFEGCPFFSSWDPGNTMKWKRTNKHFLHIWKCCSDTVDNFKNSDPHFRPNNERICKGYMTLDENLKLLTEIKTKIIGNFRTLNFMDCLNTCEHKRDCQIAHFNQTVGLCILTSGDQLMQNDQISSLMNYDLGIDINQTFQFWKWHCSSPIEYQSPSIPKSCVCLNKTDSSVKLFYYECSNKFTEISKRKLYKGIAFNKLLMDDENLALLSDGYHKYLISKNASYFFNPCPNFLCELNDGIMKSTTECLIYSRSSWFAKKPNLTEPIVTKYANYVIITDVSIMTDNELSCDSFAECISTISILQYLHMSQLGLADITFNFLIGNNGDIFEGRGFNKTNWVTYGYEYRSLAIAFIGVFKNNSPSLAALNSAKRLIAYGLFRGFINESYTLVGDRDLTPHSDNPGLNLHRLIQSWPNYINEKNQVPKHCQEPLLPAILTSFALTVILMIFLCFVLRRHSLICRQLVKQFSIDANLSIISLFHYDVSMRHNLSDDVTVRNNLPNNFKINDCQIYFASNSSHTNCPTQEALSELLNMRYEFESPNLFNNNSFLNFCLSKCNLVTLVLMVAPTNELESKTLIVIHTSNKCDAEHIIDLCRNRLNAKVCICWRPFQSSPSFSWLQLNKGSRNEHRILRASCPNCQTSVQHLDDQSMSRWEKLRYRGVIKIYEDVHS